MNDKGTTPRPSSNFDALARVVNAIETLSEWYAFEKVLNKTELNDEERLEIRRAWTRQRLLIDGGALPSSEITAENVTAEDFIALLADAQTLRELRDLDCRAAARRSLGLFNNEEHERITRAILKKEQFIKEEQTIDLDYFFRLLHTVEDVEEYTAQVERRADVGEITSTEKTAILKKLDEARERIEAERKRRAKT